MGGLAGYKETQQSGLMQNKNGKIHKQMGDQGADNHSVGFQKKICVKAEPTDKSRISAHQQKQGKIARRPSECFHKTFDCKIKVKKSSYRQRNKVKD